VKRIVEEELRTNGTGIYSRGLSSEGFAGGYYQALLDVAAALLRGYPSDHRGYWRKAERKGFWMVRKKDLKWPRAIALWGYVSTDSEGWRQAEDDARRFANKWGRQAVVLGWTEENVIGLIWSLQGRRVVAMTTKRAAIGSASSEVTFYRRMAAS
jgi:hypothetical protein